MSKKNGKTSYSAFRTIGRLCGYMFSSHGPGNVKTRRGGLILAALCMALSAFCTARGTAFLDPAISEYIVPLIGQQDPDMTGLISILLKMGLLYGLGALASWLQARIMVNVSNDTLYSIRTDLFAAMQDKPLESFNTHSQGYVISLFSNDVNAMGNMLRTSLPRIANGIVSSVCVCVSMLLINWRLALLVFVCVAALVLFLKGLVKKNKGHFSRQQRELAGMSSCAGEYIGGRYVVKAFGQEENACRKFNDINGSLATAAFCSSFFSDAIFNLTNGLANIGYTVIVLAGAFMITAGLADLGDVGTILQYYQQLQDPMKDMSKQFNNILSALAGAERVFDFLDSPAEEDRGTVRLVKQGDDLFWQVPDKNGKVLCKPFCGHIRFDHVDFGYQAGQTVLHDFTLDIPPGKKTAFVGTTGAGKTTVINLISRFYEIQSGSITCDGIDLRNVSKADLRHAASVVLQDVNLFTGTIDENIRFGSESAEADDVIQAAQIVQADRFIRQLPDEYNTVITHNGEGLSNGQKQLLSLARTAVTDAPILIMDEATGSVDTRTEQIINRGLDVLMENRTVLVIAHRLSTIENADQIVVLEHGCIVETGTYQELIAHKRAFYRLSTILPVE